MQAFVAWFADPLVQSVVISPLVGAVLGVLFSGLNTPPSSNAPVTVHQTVVIFKKTIVVNQGGTGSPPSSSEDVWFYLIVIIGLIAGVTWGYSRYTNEILGYWLSGIFACTSFIVAAGAASAFRGQFNSPEWWWYIFAPVLAVGFSLYLVHLAQSAIISGAREAAQQYGFLDFYFHILKDEHRIWLLFQIAGVFFGVIATTAATLRSVHYLSLMNSRTNGALHGLWRFLARITLVSARIEGVILLVIAATVSYFALSGAAYEFWQRRG